MYIGYPLTLRKEFLDPTCHSIRTIRESCCIGYDRLEICEPQPLLLRPHLNVVNSTWHIASGWSSRSPLCSDILWRLEVRLLCYKPLSAMLTIAGRTLEETAALFDGDKPQRDLAQATGEAQIPADRTVYPLTERSCSKRDNPSDENWLEPLSLHKTNSKSHNSHSITSSRRNSAESV